MFTLVQLEDGTFKLVVNYEDESIKIHEEWYFDKAERSDAAPAREIFAVNIG